MMRGGGIILNNAMFYKLYPFLYQCDVLRDVEKTKDHANDKSKSVQSPPFPFY